MNPITVMQNTIRAQYPTWQTEVVGHTLYIKDVDARIHFEVHRSYADGTRFYACDVFLFNGSTFCLELTRDWQFRYVLDRIAQRSTDSFRNPKTTQEMYESFTSTQGLCRLTLGRYGEATLFIEEAPQLWGSIQYRDGVYEVILNDVTETFKEWVLVLHHVETFNATDPKPITGPEMWTNINWTWRLSTNDNSKTDKTSAVIHLQDGLQVRVTYQGNDTWLVRGVTHTTWASVVSHLMHLDRAGRNLGYWAQKARNFQIFKSWWA